MTREFTSEETAWIAARLQDDGYRDNRGQVDHRKLLTAFNRAFATNVSRKALGNRVRRIREGPRRRAHRRRRSVDAGPDGAKRARGPPSTVVDVDPQQLNQLDVDRVEFHIKMEPRGGRRGSTSSSPTPTPIASPTIAFSSPTVAVIDPWTDSDGGWPETSMYPSVFDALGYRRPRPRAVVNLNPWLSPTIDESTPESPRLEIARTRSDHHGTPRTTTTTAPCPTCGDDLAMLRERLEDKRQSARDWKRQCHEAIASATELRAQLRTVEARLEIKRRHVTDLAAQCRDAEATVTALRKRTRTYESRVGELESRVQELEDMLDERSSSSSASTSPSPPPSPRRAPSSALSLGGGRDPSDDSRRRRRHPGTTINVFFGDARRRGGVQVQETTRGVEIVEISPRR